MSTSLLPVVSPFHDAGCRVVARALLKGSPVSVAATLYVTREREIDRAWFDRVASDTGVDLRR
jgi:hypothetical protein